MGFVPFPNGAKVAMNFTNRGSIFVNTYHVKNDSPFDEASLGLLANEFKSWWENELQGITAPDVYLSAIEAYGLDSANAPGIVLTVGLPEAGTGATEALPGNVTCAIKWNTALRGRSYRGRTFHIGLQISQIDGSNLDPGAVTALTAAYQNLLTAMNSTPWTLVVASRVSNHAERTTGVMTDIQSVYVDGFLDSQRRRLSGRGT